MDSVMAAIARRRHGDDQPLSATDLIEAGTFSAQQLSCLISMIDQGASWLVGAGPGGAGKTTLMSALLTFLPSREKAVFAGPGSEWKSFGTNCCVVTEEISAHQPERYLWAEDVRGLTSVPGQGGRITSTIHADTLEQAREQIARQCDAGEDGLAAFSVFIPIEVEFAPESDEPRPEPDRKGPAWNRRGPRRMSITRRTVQHIHCHCDGTWGTIDRNARLTAEQESILRFLERCCQSGTRSCEALRREWLGQC